MREMRFSVQSVLFFYIVHQVLGNNYASDSITCYTTYDDQETRSRGTNKLLNYSFFEAHTTQYTTFEGELCSVVGCVCFSYQDVCSYLPKISNHLSQCTQQDRQNGNIKWHRGWTSIATCEQMRQQSDKYRNLTCCYANRCNDQPGKVITLVETSEPSPLYDSHIHSTKSSTFSTLHPTSFYHNRVDSIKLSTFAESQTIPPSDKYFSSPPSCSSSFYSNWILVLIFLHIILIA
ncbi:unnamed protein product [Rotaria sp. Silwood1]|nr:unnamed protein product [Rotaria sp. Silwood1]